MGVSATIRVTPAPAPLGGHPRHQPEGGLNAPVLTDAICSMTVRCRTEGAHSAGFVCLSCNPRMCATAQKEFRRQCSLRCKSLKGGVYAR
jgi:hypothetical protein